MNTKVCLAAVCTGALFLSSCARNPQDRMIGRWETEASGLKISLEFLRGGQARLTMFGQTLQGTYKLDGDELEWKLNGKTTKSKVRVTDTELDLTCEGNTVRYKRF